MCKILERTRVTILPLFIDYGQLAREKEWNACKKVFPNVNLPTPIKITINGYGNFFKSGITNKEMNIYDDAFLPGRNLLLLIIAASYGYQNNIRKIAIGLLSEEFHIFPDQTEEFIVNSNFALNSAYGKSFTIITPLIQFSKKDIVKLASKYNIPLNETYSCHAGKENYCNKCISCKEILATGKKDLFSQFTKEDD